MFKIDEHAMNVGELAEGWPVYYNFYPSPDTFRRLCLRMVQIKNEDAELWQGFHPLERESGKITYHPDELIDPYQTNFKKENND